MAHESAPEVTKAVIPAAGLGTRFLPATKAQPKEMLPIIDKPVIQYVVEEAVASGIRDILIITGRGKRAIEDHFDRSLELEEILTKRGEHELLKKIRDSTNLADIHFIRQKEALGLGNAISYAQNHVGNEPFAVLLGDDIYVSRVPHIKQLISRYNALKSSVIAVEKTPKERISRYGVISGKQVAPRTYLVEGLVEKPKPEAAPSNLAIMGRYVLSPAIFEFLKKIKPGINNEFQLTDALQLMISAGKEKLYAYEYEGKRYDVGDVTNYLKSIVDFALMRSDINGEFRRHLEKVVKGG